jgi:uncharacterized protein
MGGPMTLAQLTIDRYLELKSYFNSQPHQLCAYSLPAIIAWTTGAYEPGYLEIDGALIVSAEYSLESAKGHMLLPISPTKRFSPEALHELTLITGINAFGFVPETYILQEDRYQLERFFEVIHQPEYDDYIYRTQDLADLKGNRYAKKRNLIHQFERAYVEANRVEIQPLSVDDVEACIDFLDRWCEERDCENDPEQDLACERLACLNTLINIDHFDVNGLLIRVDDEIAAFGIGAPLTDRMGVLHFEKALSSIKGLYQYLDRACARSLFTGFEYLNKESDMGVEGLAHAKKSYYPEMKEKAYRLVAR